MELYQFLAQRIAQLRNLREDSNADDDTIKRREAIADHVEASILKLIKDRFPSGSGYDAGTQFDLDGATDTRLRFQTSFHHMNEHGTYDGWTNHDVHITPSLAHGFNVRVTGSNRNQIKDDIAEQFSYVLSQEDDFKFTLSDD